MTGPEVRRVRSDFGLDPQLFAKLLGVHPSTLYRWEQSAAALRVEPFQRQLLALLRHELDERAPPDRERLAADVTTALLFGGGLRGLFVLLRAAFGKRDYS